MLYRIPVVISELIQELAEHGEVEVDVKDILGRIDAESQHDSTECIAKAVRNCEAAATALEAEAARFAKKAERFKSIGKGLKAGMLDEIQAGLRQAGQAGTFRISVRKSPVAVIVECEPEQLPGDYQRITIAADKRKIAEALKGGAKIEGVRCERGSHIAIATSTPTSL